MGICTEDNSEEDQFFDSKEDISSVSDSGSDSAEVSDSNGQFINWVSGNLHYEVWIAKPDSVRERRDKFFKWMGLGNSDQIEKRESIDLSSEIVNDTNRITETSGAVLRSSDLGDAFSSSRCSISRLSNEGQDLSEDRDWNESSMCRIRNLDDGTEFIVDGFGRDGTLIRLREVGSNRSYGYEEFEQALGVSPLVQQFMRRAAAGNSGEMVKRRKKAWWRRLGSVACVVDREVESKFQSDGSSSSLRVGGQRVRVRPSKKRSKEFSALYMGQEIRAHTGAIFTMKFSPDGQYLASAGEDGIVRVWQVMECARTEDNIPNVDPSCIYFTMNDSAELAPLFTNEEKMGKFSSMRKTPNSACIILPPKLFRISEEPLHEFHGHSGDVLALSWSEKQYLLSASVDKSVRLWQVGCDRCLKVFSHSDYVTSVQFNPVDDNYFISGSIDGKVRIWDILGCQVVDWTNIREMVSAVCYRPDGQGGIVGSFTGDCHFYNTSGNQLQLDDQICLQGKKKSPSRRITGFQFSPSDPTKVMVTSSDSQIRILDGTEVIGKYKGFKNGGSQISASFSSNGRHIVSASEDSNVYVWNYSNPGGASPHRVKSIWSSESFFSSSASVAIPWSGMKSDNSASLASKTLSSDMAFRDSARSLDSGCRCHSNLSQSTLSFSSPDHFSMANGFFLEILPKGTATWPEEKLPTSNTLTVSSTVCKSQYKFLKTSCQNTVTSPHAWNMVIVTAGWDGRIRSFHNYGLPVRL